MRHKKNKLPKFSANDTQAYAGYRMHRSYRNRYQDGFSLIEVLVALLIISTGMLGVAGLQLVSIKGTHQTFMRHQATFLVQDIAEKIRANPLSVSNYVFDTDVANSFNCPAAKNCNATSCNAIELAAFDKSTFVCSLNQRLINARISITCDAAAAVALAVPSGCANTNQENPITVEVSWTERDFGKELNINNNIDGTGKGRTDNIFLQTTIMPKFKL